MYAWMMRAAGAALGWVAVGAAVAGPASVTVPFCDAGFFGADGRSSKEDGEALGAPTTVPGFANYHAGLSTSLTFEDEEVRNFFVFDWTDALASFGGTIPGPVRSATLRLYNPGTKPDGADGYSSPDATETYYLSDSGAASPAMVMDHYDHPLSVGPFAGVDESGDAMFVYSELASGPEFGSVAISAADDGSYVEIPLTPIGLDFLNLELGEFDMFGDPFFAFGGKITTIGGTPGGADEPDEIAFGFTHPNGFGSPDTSAAPPELLLTFVPEPASVVLLAVGVVMSRRR